MQSTTTGNKNADHSFGESTTMQPTPNMNNSPSFARDATSTIVLRNRGNENKARAAATLVNPFFIGSPESEV
jgi:hypothetical protein